MIRRYADFKSLSEAFSVPSEIKTRQDLFRFVEEYLNQTGVEVVREDNTWHNPVYHCFRLAGDWYLFIDVNGHGRSESQAVKKADFLIYKSGEPENNWTQNLDEAIALYRKLSSN